MYTRLAIVFLVVSSSLPNTAFARSACPSSPEQYDNYDCSPISTNVCENKYVTGDGWRTICEGTSDEDEIYAVWDSTYGPFIWGNVGGLFCCDSGDLGASQFELWIYLFQSDDIACAHLDGEANTACYDYNVSPSESWEEVVHIFGGAGDDDIVAANDSVAHDDELMGGDGDAVIYAYAGADEVNGNDGRDQIYGGEGADDLLGGSGPDTVVGGAGDDVILGGAGNDSQLDGDEGDDSISGGAGSDDIDGGDGADDIDGGDGGDTLDGGDGDDCICAGMDSATDTIDGETDGADCYFDTTSTPNPDTYANCTVISNDHPTDPCGCL